MTKKTTCLLLSLFILAALSACGSRLANLQPAGHLNNANPAQTQILSDQPVNPIGSAIQPYNDAVQSADSLNQTLGKVDTLDDIGSLTQPDSPDHSQIDALESQINSLDQSLNSADLLQDIQ